MTVALIGYGRMGHEIENIALKRGHEISKIFDEHNQNEFTPQELMDSDVAIEFTVPLSAYSNIMQCFKANIPVVSGTTGWLSDFDKIEKECLTNNQTFFYAPNYSLGVNVFFNLNKYLAKWMNKFHDYNVMMEEIHHIHKKDAPSGTAVALADDLIEIHDKKNKWVADSSEIINGDEFLIISHREDQVPGTHKIQWESEEDSIEIIHTAKNRKGFALGAVLAAEFIVDKKGVYNMGDLLGS